MDNSDDIRFILGEVKGKLDSLLVMHTDVNKDVKGLAVRVSALEQFKWMLMGGAGVVGWLVSLISELFKGGH